METQKTACVYLLGVGGMGMAPLARFLVDRGYAVFGWDDFATEARKRQLSFVGWQKAIPEACDVCVYSPAVDEHNSLRIAAGCVCPCVVRGAFVAQLLARQRLCAICGSHGKSTTTAFLIHFFKRHNIPVNYIGGAEFQSDFYESACGANENVWTLLELDESDGTIGQFSPNVTVILNTDWDHPRRYMSAEMYKQMFESLAFRTKECVISNECFPSLHARQLRIPSAPTILETDVTAAGVAFRYLTGETVTTSDIASFPGLKRRQEVLLKTEYLKILSDYAHHPGELRALLQALEKENRTLVVAFEPHRASRLKCYFGDFVRELKHCPQVYIHPLYEAFEAVDCGAQALLEAIPNAQPLEQLKPEDCVACERPIMLVFAGAGKIDAYAHRWVEQWIRAVAGFFTTRGVTLKTNVSLKNASTMGIGGSALFVCEPESMRELQALLRVCRSVGLRLMPLGGGSNVLIPEETIDGVVVRLNGDCWNFCTFVSSPNGGEISNEVLMRCLEASISSNSGVSIRKIDGSAGFVNELSKADFLKEKCSSVDRKEQFADKFEQVSFKGNADVSGVPKADIKVPEAVWVYVGAGMCTQVLIDAAEVRGVGGFEFLDGIPGTVGGALAVNAGTGRKGILDIAERVVWVDRESAVHISAHSELNYGYRSCETFRDGVIMSVFLRGYRSATDTIRRQRAELRRKRECSQPKGKTVGCFFKNPKNCSAGQLLEQCGAKGKRVGEIFVSDLHANFIVNGGNGRFFDVVRLVKQLRRMVYEQSAIWLEPEVRLLGKSWEEFL